MRKINYWNAIVIAIILGTIGLQHFYVKQTVLGVLGVLFCWTGIPAIVALVQAAVWLFKGENWFNAKYCSKTKTRLDD